MSSNPLKLVPEQYESSAEAQSQSQNLVPRKCWLHITQLLVKPTLFEKNQKLRIIIHIPNSNREVKTKKISIDDNVIKYLMSNMNSAGLTSVPIDVTVVYEYKHDIQLEHPPIMGIEVEIISSILGRSKSVGQINVNMAEIIQKNQKSTFTIQKDSQIIASIQAEIHSLCLSKTTPTSITRSNSNFSDSDSEVVSESFVITDHMIQQMLRDRKVLFLDESTHQGQVLRQGLSVKDFVIPVKNNTGVQGFLNVAAQFFPYSSPIVIIMAGDDDFISMILKEMVVYREKGLISLDSFHLFVLPLSKNKSNFAKLLGKSSPAYASAFLSETWLSIFPEDSAVQNVGQQIGAAVDSIFASKLKKVDIPSCDVLVTTLSDQFVVPMFAGITIGDSSQLTSSKPTENVISMKCSFTQAKQKSVQIKFHHFKAVLDHQGINVNWKQLTNANLIPMIQSFDKYVVEEGSEKCNKFGFNLSKGQQPVDIYVDGVTIKAVIGVNVTPRDRSNSVELSAFA